MNILNSHNSVTILNQQQDANKKYEFNTGVQVPNDRLQEDNYFGAPFIKWFKQQRLPCIH